MGKAPHKTSIMHVMGLTTALMPPALACTNVTHPPPRSAETSSTPHDIKQDTKPPSDVDIADILIKKLQLKAESRFKRDMENPTVAEITGEHYRVPIADPAAEAERNIAMRRYRVLNDIKYPKKPQIEPSVSGATVIPYTLGDFSNPHVADAIREAVATINSYSQLKLVERDGGIVINQADLESNRGEALPTSIALDVGHLGTTPIEKDSDKYNTILHELLHTLGAGHNYETNTLYGLESDNPDSVMHYGNPKLGTLGRDDIAYLQAFFGANWEHNNGDTTYGTEVITPYQQVIWDAGGTDTVDFSNDVRWVHLSLGEGQEHWSGSADHKQRFQFSYGSNIENATITQGHLQGNALDNVLESRMGYIKAFAGDDVLYAHEPQRKITLEGGTGSDIFAIETARNWKGSVQVVIPDFDPEHDLLVLSGGTALRGAFLLPKQEGNQPWVARFHFADDEEKRQVNVDIALPPYAEISQAFKHTEELTTTVSQALVYLAQMPSANTPKGWRDYIEERTQAGKEHDLSR